MVQKYAKDQPAGYENYIRNIAIVGAGGQIGKFIVEYLLKNPKHTITALTRKGSTSKIPAGVKTAYIDYDDESTMVAALKGQDCLIISLAVTAAPGTQGKLCKAAADAGVPWVMPNEWGINLSGSAAADTVILSRKRQEREYIESLGVSSWISLSCGFWYEFSLAGSADRYGFDLRKREVTFFDDGNVKLCTSTFDQVGRAAAAVLALPILPRDASDTGLTLERFRNGFAYTSSFRVSQRDMLASLLRATGTTEADWKTTSVGARERWATSKAAFEAGDRAAVVRVLYTRMFMDDAPSDFVARLDNKALGLPEEDLDKSTAVAVQMDKDGYFGSRY